jgi:magnesium transporter
MEWHHIQNAQDHELDLLAERYRLHPLHIEDCRTRLNAPKIEESDHYLFTVLKSIEVRHSDSANGLELELVDLNLFLGKDFLITVPEGSCPELEQRLERLKAVANGENRADELFYRVIDATVDSYLPVLDHYDDLIDDIEDEAMESGTQKTLAKIFDTKRDLIRLRRVLVNTRDVMAFLQRIDSPFIDRSLWPFLRDVYDHVARNLDLVEMERDLLSGSLDVYLSSVANRTNRVMKVLTVLSTVALPALVVTGFYGMNVRNLPFSESSHGLAIVMSIMGLGTALMLVLFKRLDWI